jgi:hypothetical protein
MSSSKYVNAAIDAYGIDKFNKKILFIFNSREQALKMEMRLHEKFNVANNPLFFNRCNATEFGFLVGSLYTKGKTYEDMYGENLARELKQRRSEAMKSHSKIRNYDKENNPNFGNKWSDEQKKQLSEKLGGDRSKIKGSFWVTDGNTNIKLKKGSQIPEGMYRGRVVNNNPPNHKGMKWYNNGVINIVCAPEVVLDGFVVGKLNNI